ncbi:hypothetical protein HDR58_07580 [bacterium]|nr:hypothetical protein [bacterium]
MSISVQSISFTSNNQPQKNNTKEKVQETATIAGGTGYLAKAMQNAQKTVNEGEKVVRTTMETTTKAAKLTSRITKESTGFITKFQKHMQKYAAEFMNFVSKFTNNKYLSPIVKSPIVGKCSKAFGGVMAFFALASGLTKAAENGSLAICDIKNTFKQSA